MRAWVVLGGEACIVHYRNFVFGVMKFIFTINIKNAFFTLERLPLIVLASYFCLIYILVKSAKLAACDIFRRFLGCVTFGRGDMYMYMCLRK